MSATTIQLFRNAIIAKANEKYGSDEITLALALGAIEIYIAAWQAYEKSVANTVSSYSINGRSISKATPDKDHMRVAYRALRQYFPQLPIDQSASTQFYKVDFSEV